MIESKRLRDILLFHQTSTNRHKSLVSSDGQGTTSVGPVKWLGHRLVEVINKVQNAQTQVIDGGKAGPLQQLANQNTKPNLNLIQPGSMLGGVNKTNTVTFIFQERLSCFHRLQDTRLALDAEIIFD